MSTVSASRVPSEYAYSHNGELIYQRRRERGLTQEQLAKKLEVDVKTVRRWEIGDVNFGMVSIYTAWRIATVLGLDFWVLAAPDGADEDPLFFLDVRAPCA